MNVYIHFDDNVCIVVYVCVKIAICHKQSLSELPFLLLPTSRPEYVLTFTCHMIRLLAHLSFITSSPLEYIVHISVQ